MARERAQRSALLDFLRGVMHLDPVLRWTPRQAAAHPFITGAPFTQVRRGDFQTKHVLLSNQTRFTFKPNTNELEDCVYPRAYTALAHSPAKRIHPRLFVKKSFLTRSTGAKRLVARLIRDR
eukprot:1178673-Prorocentrum_minimum.AAC.2